MLLVDTHVHLYPESRNKNTLAQILRRMIALTPEQFRSQAIYALCIVERFGYGDWDGIIPFTDPHEAGLRSFTAQEFLPKLWLIQGFQTATAERIEVLSLATSSSHPPLENMPLLDTLEAVNQSYGIPVIPWSFGKWMFKRKKILVRALHQNPSVILGDIPSSPSIIMTTLTTVTKKQMQATFALPSLLNLPSTQRVLLGTDPLPLKGESQRIGSSFSVLEHNEKVCSLGSLRHSLSEGALINLIGYKHSYPRTIGNLLRLKLATLIGRTKS